MTQATGLPMTSDRDFLTAKNLSKSFGGGPGRQRRLLYHRGAGDIRPAGAQRRGKTTTIRMLATVLDPDAGEIEIGSYLVRGQPSRVRTSSASAPRSLPSTRSCPRRTTSSSSAGWSGLGRREAKEAARGNLEAGRAGREGVRRRAEVLRRHEAPGQHRRCPDEQAEAAVPRRAHRWHRPPVPQPHLRHRAKAARRGMTVLYTTHYMEEADRLCDRIGIIDGGR